MDNDTTILLTGTGQETGNVHEGYDRNIESVAETYETGCFTRCVDVEHAGHIFWLVGDEADALSVETAESGYDISCKLFLAFEEVTVVDNGTDNLQYIVRFVRIVRNNFVERILQTVDSVVASYHRSLFEVVRRQEAQQLAERFDTVLFVIYNEVGYTALGCVYGCTSQLFLCNLFTGDGFYHFRSGYEHVAGALIHQNEVSQCR